MARACAKAGPPLTLFDRSRSRSRRRAPRGRLDTGIAGAPSRGAGGLRPPRRNREVRLQTIDADVSTELAVERREVTHVQVRSSDPPPDGEKRESKPAADSIKRSPTRRADVFGGQTPYGHRSHGQRLVSAFGVHVDDLGLPRRSRDRLLGRQRLGGAHRRNGGVVVIPATALLEVVGGGWRGNVTSRDRPPRLRLRRRRKK